MTTTVREKKPVPGVQQNLPFRYSHFARYMDDPLQFWMDDWRRFGDVFRFTIGPEQLHLIAYPDHVRHVLVDRRENDQRGKRFEVLKYVVGANNLTSDGEFWKQRFQVVAPALSRERMEAFGPLITKATAELLDGWQAQAGGRPFNVMTDLLTLQTR
jgi:cytochrome P450